VADVRSSEVDEKLALVSVRQWRFVCWQSFEARTAVNKTALTKDQKYKHGGRLKDESRIWFYGDNSWTVAVKQMKFGAVKIMDMPTSLRLFG
jgi:hypothetical protein